MNSAQSSLAAALAREGTAMQALLDVLLREQACLVCGDAHGCAALLDDKARRVAALAVLAAERHQWLAASGFGADEDGMTAWLHTVASTSGETDVRHAWETLMAVTRAAHQHNGVNGVLLGQLAARNRQALAALSAVVPHAAGDTLYGPGGQADLPRRAATHVLG